MKRQWSLKTRISFITATILSIGALLTMIVISQVAKVRFEDEKYQEITERQSRFDGALLDILNRITLGYLDLFDDTSDLSDYFFDPLNDKSQKEAFFGDLLADSQIDPDTFGEVVIFYENDFYRGAFEDRVVSYPDVGLLTRVFTDAGDTLDFAGVYGDTENNDYFVFTRKIITMYPDRDAFAVVLFYVKTQLIYDILLTITSPLLLEDGFSYIETQSNELAFSIRPDLIVSGFHSVNWNEEAYALSELNGLRVILISSTLSEVKGTYRNIDFRVVSVLSYDRIFQDIVLLNRLILIIGGISILLIAFVSRQLASSLTKPLKMLIRNLRHFADKKTKTGLITPQFNDEIAELERTYDEMINQIIELINTNNLEMENKRKLELYALQMQINPHFLYNTLDTIAWMAKLKKEPDIEKLVLALAKFFRISLHKGDKYITIEEEFDLVRNFVEVQIIRFPNQFVVEYQLDSEIKSASTLKLVLQPIVENAIKHGFVGLNRMGHINISAKMDGTDDILFEVTDDGIGFLPTDDLFSEKRLLDGLGGYGLKNVDERIKLEYGREYGIRVESEANIGTKVFIKIKKTA